MPRSATPAARSEATRRWKAPKDPFCRTSYRHGHTALTRTVADGCERLRTVANGCERLRTQTQRPANTALPPHPQSETGTLATHSGMMVIQWGRYSSSDSDLVVCENGVVVNNGDTMGIRYHILLWDLLWDINQE